MFVFSYLLRRRGGNARQGLRATREEGEGEDEARASGRDPNTKAKLLLLLVVQRGANTQMDIRVCAPAAAVPQFNFPAQQFRNSGDSTTRTAAEHTETRRIWGALSGKHLSQYLPTMC